MYRIISLAISLLVLSGLQAQELPLYSTGAGVLTQLPGLAYVYQTMELDRLQRGRFKLVGQLTPPVSEEALKTRYFAVKAFFPQALQNETRALSTVWQYIIERKTPDSLAVFRHPAVQIAMGLAFLDEDTESESVYRYQLRRGDQGITWSGEIQFLPHRFDHAPFSTRFSSRDDELPLVEWISERASGMADYEVYRRKVGETDYQEIYPLRQKAQKGDSLQLMMTDTTVAAEGVYEYYAVPLDRLGNRGHRSQSTRAGNFSTRTQPQIHQFQAFSHPDLRAISLSWALWYPERVRSLTLFRSRSSGRDFERIREFAPTDTSFIDPVDDPGEGYFYYLQINDITGKDLRSVTIFGIYSGSQVAEAPVRLAVRPEEDGIHLGWQSRDASVRGYYVYRGLGYRGDLQQVSAFIPVSSGQTYVDTTQLHAHQVYCYAVKAESKSYSLSDFSDRVGVRPVSPTSISPPLSLQSQLLSDGIRLKWENLSRREVYLTAYHVYRKTADQDSFVRLNRAPISFHQNYFLDEQVDPGQVYQYAVQAVNAFGAVSSLSKITEIELPLPRFPERLGARKQPTGIALQWNSPVTTYAYQVQIYRSSEQGEVELLAQRDPGQSGLMDEQVEKGALYTYQLVCVDVQGKPLFRAAPLAIRY